MNLSLDPNIYSKKHIAQAIKDWKEVATLSYKNGVLHLESIADKDLDSNALFPEFVNYLIALHI